MQRQHKTRKVIVMAVPPEMAFGGQKSTGLRDSNATSVTSYRQIGKKGLQKGVAPMLEK